MEVRKLLAADILSQENNDTISSAQAANIATSTEFVIEGYIGDGAYGTADVDMFQITLAPGETLSADIDSYVLDDGTNWSYGGYSHLRLFDSYGGEVADSYYYETNDPDSGYGGDPVLEYTSAYGGTYYLGVSSDGNDAYDSSYGGSGYGGSAFDYQLELNVDDGYGGAPEIDVYNDQYGGSIILDDYGSYAFGTTDLGTDLTRTFRVTNSGTDTLTLGSISTTSSFSVDSSFSSTSLGPGDEATFTIRFDADSVGTFNGTISFSTNDSDENPFNFDLSGTVTSSDIGDTRGTAQSVGLTPGTQTQIDSKIGDGAYGTADVDMFQVTLNAGETLSADIDSYVLDDGTNWSYGGYSHLRLFDSYGGEVADSYYYETNDPDSGYGGDPFMEYTSAYGGTYYLGVSTDGNDFYDPDYGGSGYSGSSFDYQLELNIEDAFTGSPEIDVNNDQYGGSVILDDYGSYAFGTTDLGTDLTRTFRVKNSGTDTLTLGSITTTSSFSVDSSFGSTSLAPGAYTTFTIRFDADSAGAFNGSVAFSTNDSDENPFNFDLSGSVTSSSDIGDTRSTAQSVSLTPGVQTQIDSKIGDGSYGTADVDMFQITLAAGETLSADIDSYVLDDGTNWSYGGYSHLRLFDSYGGEVADSYYYEANDPDSGYGGDPVLEYTSAYGGIYYLGISSDGNDSYDSGYGGSGYGGSSFDYQLELNIDDGYGGSPEITVYDDEYGGNSIVDGSGSFAFGTTDVGNPVTQTFRVTNDGDAPLTLGNIILPIGFGVYSGFGTTTLSPGQSTTFQLRLAAANPGNYGGSISFETNDSDEDPFDFIVSGVVDEYGGEPEITVLDELQASVTDDVSTVDFGSTDVGTPIDQVFTIHNDGDDDLTLNSSSMAVPSGWQVTQNFSTTVTPGNSTSFTLRFLATAAGTSSGTVSFLNNDIDEGTFSFDVTAVANVVSAPELTVLESGSSLQSGNSKVDFGNVSEHEFATRTIEIRNDGTQTLTLDTGSIQVPSGYQVVTLPASSVASGSSTTLVLKLASTTLGDFSGAIQFTSNDSDESPFSFDVTGDVVAHVPDMSINDQYTQEGNTATFTVTLSDTSSATISVDYATIANTATAGVDYTHVSGTLTFLPGETTKTIEVPILSDTDSESEELFSVQLSNVSGANLLGAVGEGHILDYLPPNEAPTVASPLADLTIDEDSATTVVELGNVFDDANLIYGDVLTYSVVSSDTDLASITIVGSELRIAPNPDQNGTATVTVTATDSEGLQVSDSFLLNVTPVNDSPERSGLVPDLFATMNDDPVVVDLSEFLTDVDDSLTYSATTPDGDLVATSVTGSELTVTLLADQFGTAEITVTGTDSQGLTTEDTFRVVITRTNAVPTVVSPIANMNVDEDFSTISVDLSTVFGDSDLINLSDSLTYQLRQNDNDLEADKLSIIDAYISQGNLILTPAPGVAGQATLTVRATDEFTEFVDETFTIIVNAINDAPEVVSPISDQASVMNGDPLTFDLGTVFTDKDLDTTGDSLTYSVADNTNATVVSASVSEGVLTLTPLTDQYGDSTLTIRATDAAGAYVDHVFDMSVAYQEQAPTVGNAISDMAFTEDGVPVLLDLSSVFSDADIAITGDSLTYSFSLAGDEIVSVELIDDQLTLTPISDASGVSSITVTATDTAGNLISDTFDFTLTPVDDLPQVLVDPLTLTYSEGVLYSLVDLTNILQDPDVPWSQDTVAYSVEANDNSALAATTITGGELRLDFTADTTGTVNLTLRATDGNSQYVETTLSIVIEAEATSFVGQIRDVELVNDTGSSSDKITSNAGVVGEVYGVNQDYQVVVEFDHNNDGIAEGTEILERPETIPVDYFVYDPRTTDETLEDYYGALTLRYRSALIDDLDIVTTYLAWDSFAYDIVAPNASFVTSSIGLVNDTGTNTSDKVTTDAELEGTVANHPYAQVELDLNGDDVADETVFADEEGNWSTVPLLTAYGAITIGHRTRHWDSESATFVAGPWNDFAFTLEPDAAPEIENFWLLEEALDDEPDGSPYVTSSPVLVGNLLEPVVEETIEEGTEESDLPIDSLQIISDLAYLEIEVDLDGDGNADVSVFTDENGAFTYAPKGLSDGSNTIQARSVRIDWRTGQNVYGTWKSYTFEFASAPIPEVEQLRLANDTGSSNTDQVTEDTTLTGRLSFIAGLPVGGEFVEFDHDGDDIIDGLAEIQTDGTFTYLPPGLAAGNHTIRARVTVWSDNDQDFVGGTWTSISIEKFIPVNTPATIAEFRLFNDNGVDPADGISTDPAVAGLISNDEGVSYMSVEFDHDGDGVVDGRTTAEENGEFVYVPLGVGQGTHTINARVREWDYYAQAFIYGTWEPTTFTIAQPVNDVAAITSLGLLSDTGTSSSDNTTANASLVGTVANVEGVSGLEIEFDQDNDGTADDRVFTDSVGNFYVDPYLLDFGTHTFQARVKEWDHYAGTYLTSGWTSITIVYEDQVNSAAEIIALGVSGAEDINGTLTSASTLIQGQIRNESQLAGITIEIDTDGDGTTDAYAQTDQRGRFEYQLPTPAAGSVSLDMRTREFDWETGSELIGSWQSLTFDFAPDLNEAAELVDVSLVNDTGELSDDLITTDSSIRGRITNDGALDGLQVQVDINGDGIFDQTATTNVDGEFQLDVVGLTPGEHTLKLRVKEYNEQNVALYSDWTAFNFELEAISLTNQSGVDALGLLNDTGLSDGDLSTADATLSGMLSGGLGTGNITIEFDHDGDGIIDGTTTSQSGGMFQYLPSNLESGYQSIQARIAGGGEWRTMEFVVSDMPDSTEAQDLASSIFNYQSAFDQIQVDYQSALDNISIDYSSRIAGAVDSYDSAIATATGSYDDAIQSADSQFDSVLSQAKAQLLAAQAAANAQFQIDMANFTGDKTQFEFNGFSVPDAIQFASANVPANSEMPTAPTYGSEPKPYYYEVDQDPLVKEALANQNTNRILETKESFRVLKQAETTIQQQAANGLATVITSSRVALNEALRDGKIQQKANESESNPEKADAISEFQHESAATNAIDEYGYFSPDEDSAWNYQNTLTEFPHLVEDDSLYDKLYFVALYNFVDPIFQDEWNEALASYNAVAGSETDPDILSSMRVTFWKDLDSRANQLRLSFIDELEEFQNEIARKRHELKKDLIRHKAKLDQKLIKSQAEEEIRKVESEFSATSAQTDMENAVARTQLQNEITTSSEKIDATIQYQSALNDAQHDAQSSASSARVNAILIQTTADGSLQASYQAGQAQQEASYNTQLRAEVQQYQNASSLSKATTNAEITNLRQAGLAEQSASRDTTSNESNDDMKDAIIDLINANEEFRTSEIKLYRDYELALEDANLDHVLDRISLYAQEQRDRSQFDSDQAQNSYLCENTYAPEIPESPGGNGYMGCSTWDGMGEFYAISVRYLGGIESAKTDADVAELDAMLDYYNGSSSSGEGDSTQGYYALLANYQNKVIDITSDYQKSVLSAQNNEAESNEEVDSETEKSVQQLQLNHRLAEVNVKHTLSINQAGLDVSHQSELISLQESFRSNRMTAHRSDLEAFNQQHNSAWSQMQLDNLDSYETNIADSVDSAIDGLMNQLAGFAETLSNAIADAEKTRAESSESDVSNANSEAREASRESNSAARRLAASFATKMIDHQATHDKALNDAQAALDSAQQAASIEYHKSVLQNALSPKLLNLEWVYQVPGNPPSETVADAVATQFENDLDAKEDYSITASSATKDHVHAVEDANVALANSYKTEATQYASDGKSNSDSLRESMAGIIKSLGGKLIGHSKTAANAAANAEKNYTVDSQQAETDLYDDITPAQNTHNQDVLVNQNNFSLGFFTDFVNQLTNAGASAGAILNAQAEQNLVQASNASSEGYSTAMNAAITALVSGMGSTANTYVSGLASAAQSMAQGQIASSSAYATAASAASIDAEKGAGDAESEFAHAEYLAYLDAMVAQVQAEATAAKSNADADHIWVTTVAPFKKARDLAVHNGTSETDADQQFNSSKESADTAHENAYKTNGQTQIEAVGNAVVSYATAYQGALTTRASAVGQVETGLVSAMNQAASTALQRVNSASSATLGKVKSAESQQASGLQNTLETYSLASNNAEIGRLTARQPAILAYAANTTTAQFTEHIATSNTQLAKSDAYLSANPGARASIENALAQGNAAFIAANESIALQRVQGIVTAQTNNELANVNLSASLQTSVSNLSDSYDGSVRSASSQLESAVQAKSSSYVESLLSARGTFENGRAEANSSIGTTMAEDYGQYLIDVATAWKTFQAETFDENPSAESNFDSALLNADLAQITNTAEASLTWSTTVSGKLGDFNSTSVSAKTGLLKSNATASKMFATNVAGKRKDLEIGLYSNLNSSNLAAMTEEMNYASAEVASFGIFISQQASSQQTAVAGIHSELSLPYTQTLVDRANAQVNATNALTSLQNQLYADATIAATSTAQANQSAAGAASQTTSQAEYSFSIALANSEHAKQSAIADSLGTSGSQLAQAIGSFQQSAAEAEKDFQIAVQTAQRQFENDNDETARDSAISAASSDREATLAQLSQSYISSVFSLEGNQATQLARELTTHQNNVGQASQQAVQSVFGAATTHANVTSGNESQLTQDIASLRKSFAQQQASASESALIAELSNNTDPWSVRLLAQEAARHAAADAIWAGYEDWASAQADADTESTIDMAAAEAAQLLAQSEAQINRNLQEMQARELAVESTGQAREQEQPSEAVAASEGVSPPTPVQGPANAPQILNKSSREEIKTSEGVSSEVARNIELTGFAIELLGPELGRTFAQNHGLRSLERLKAIVDHGWSIEVGGPRQSVDLQIDSHPQIKTILLDTYIETTHTSPQFHNTTKTATDIKEQAKRLNQLIREDKVTYNGNGIGNAFDDPIKGAVHSFGQSPFAIAAVGVVPVVGEVSDIYVMAHPDSTTFERTVAAGSLGVNILTAGFLPNFGGVVGRVARSSDEIAGAASGSTRAANELVTDSIDTVGEVVETQAKQVPNAVTSTAKSTENALDVVAGQLPTCFVAGTPVCTPNGSKNIENLKVGDVIWTRPEDDPSANIRESYIERVFELAGTILELRVNGHLIETTSEHPFYVVGDGWKPGHQLEPGDRLAGLSEDSSLVESVTVTEHQKKVYNLRVAEDHTYFIGGDDWGFAVWVHNSYSVKPNANGTFDILDDAGNVVKDGISDLPTANKYIQAFNNGGVNFADDFHRKIHSGDYYSELAGRKITKITALKNQYPDLAEIPNQIGRKTDPSVLARIQQNAEVAYANKGFDIIPDNRFGDVIRVRDGWVTWLYSLDGTFKSVVVN
ncbi:choice-of-anchor D domain-containing protein [Bremerella alba]|uniref:choice-of-anchor D domain-containing protein n=1 Tax=Bremerella alba TaxID=980252 RepID=UPI001A95544A|nr:choice-of-anchor D domain-containing protein [Bremerella alba]